MIRPFPALLLFLAAILAAGLSPTPRASQDEPDSPEGTAAAVYALKVDLGLEKTRLERRLADYADAESRREALRDQITALYVQIGALVRKGEPPAAEEGDDLDGLAARVQAAEQAEAATRETLRRLREQITDSRERIHTFQERITELKRIAPPEPEGLTGVWDVTLLPGGDRGQFTLRQSGTIISGEYQQEGGWRGSLQGTLVNNKLVLHRIDSKLGSSSDLEGTVTSDLKSVKGTWQSLVLSDGLPSTGNWVGRRREPRKKSDGGAP